MLGRELVMYGMSFHRQIAKMDFRIRSIGPGSLDRQNRTVGAVIATETPVPMFDWTRMEVIPEVLLIRGAILPEQVPLLDNHQRYSLHHVMGSVRSLMKESVQISGRIHFSSVAKQPFTQVAEGHLTDVSIGYKVTEKTYVPVGSTQNIEGRNYAGPINVVTRWKLFEVSLTSIGLDEQAKIRGLGPIVVNDVQQAMETFQCREAGPPVTPVPHLNATLAHLERFIREEVRAAMDENEREEKLQS